MATITLEHSRHQIQTEFEGDSVVHTTYTSDIVRVEVTTRWRRNRQIGSGAYGAVWLEKEEGGELRAVKRIPKQQLDTQKIDFSRELDALAKLRDHRNLFVYFLGWYENTEFIYIATEYIEHGDLSQYLKKNGPRPEIEARDITKQLLRGLVVLHELRICHRDLKPQNILISHLSPIMVKIADFGMSKRQEGTELRTVVGTANYFAPELLGLLPRTKNGYTNAVDLWALGNLVHEILTSEVAFLEGPQDDDSAPPTFIPESAKSNSLGPNVDMKRLYEYCHVGTPFPIESLQNFKVSEEGIDFVKSLLVVNPRRRVSATEALRSLWLREPEPAPPLPPGSPIVTLAAHDRVSPALAVYSPFNLEYPLHAGNREMLRSVLLTHDKAPGPDDGPKTIAENKAPGYESIHPQPSLTEDSGVNSKEASQKEKKMTLQEIDVPGTSLDVTLMVNTLSLAGESSEASDVTNPSIHQWSNLFGVPMRTPGSGNIADAPAPGSALIMPPDDTDRPPYESDEYRNLRKGGFLVPRRSAPESRRRFQSSNKRYYGP